MLGFGFRGTKWLPPKPETRNPSPKEDADRAADRRDVAGGLEVAGLVVDPEVDDGVAVLVGGVEEGAARVDREVAGRLALGGGVANRRQPPGLLVDGEDGDAVVAPVRDVDEVPGRLDQDL